MSVATEMKGIHKGLELIVLTYKWRKELKRNV